MSTKKARNMNDNKTVDDRKRKYAQSCSRKNTHNFKYSNSKKKKGLYKCKINK